MIAMSLVEITLFFDHNGGSAWVDRVDHEHKFAKFDVIKGGQALGGDDLLKSVYSFSTFSAEDHTRLDTMVGGAERRRRKKSRK
jgi:hypothetical protein